MATRSYVRVRGCSSSDPLASLFPSLSLQVKADRRHYRCDEPPRSLNPRASRSRADSTAPSNWQNCYSHAPKFRERFGLTVLDTWCWERFAKSQAHLSPIAEYMCHCYARSDGLSGVLITDHEYPNRVAHTFISKVRFRGTIRKLRALAKVTIPPIPSNV